MSSASIILNNSKLKALTYFCLAIISVFYSMFERRLISTCCFVTPVHFGKLLLGVSKDVTKVLKIILFIKYFMCSLCCSFLPLLKPKFVLTLFTCQFFNFNIFVHDADSRAHSRSQLKVEYISFLTLTYPLDFLIYAKDIIMIIVLLLHMMGGWEGWRGGGVEGGVVHLC